MDEQVDLGVVQPVVERRSVPLTARALAGLVPLTLAAGVVTAAVGVSSGSSGHQVSGARLAQLRGAATAVAKLGSYRSTFTEVLHVKGESVTIKGDQSFDRAHHLGETTLTTTGPGISRTVHEVITPDDIYVQDQDGQWAKAAIPAELKDLGTDSNLSTLGALDKVRDEGRATTDGVPTEHYRGVFSAALLDKLAKVASSVATGNSAAVKLGTGIALRSLANSPIDVFVDDQGLPRRMTFDLRISALGQKVTGDATALFSGYGQPVSITVPTAATSYPPSSPSSPRPPPRANVGA